MRSLRRLILCTLAALVLSAPAAGEGYHFTDP